MSQDDHAFFNSVQKEQIDSPTRISKNVPMSGTNLTYQFSHVKISEFKKTDSVGQTT